MNKCKKTILALAMAAVLLFACIPCGICAEELVEHKIALTDLRIAIPDGWYYGDRGITDDDPFCKGLKVTAEEFKEQYLYDNEVLIAFDGKTTSYLKLGITDSGISDYTEMSEGEIQEQGEKHYRWLLSDDSNVLQFKGAVQLGRPYYKVVSKDDDKICCYYDTVRDGKRYEFLFIINAEYYSGDIDKLYDSIVSSLTF